MKPLTAANPTVPQEKASPGRSASRAISGPARLVLLARPERLRDPQRDQRAGERRGERERPDRVEAPGLQDQLADRAGRC